MVAIAKPIPTVVESPVDRLPSSPPLRTVVARPWRNADTYNSHPGYGLSADALISYFRTAERGQPVYQFDLFDDIIERDCDLRGLLDGRTMSVTGKDWVLVPGRLGHAASEKAATDLESALKNDLGFRDFLEHQLTAPSYGIAATNLVWDFVDRLIIPTRFVNVAHRRFAAPSQDRVGELMLIAGDSSTELLPLDPGLWAVSKYRHRNPYAAGLMRTAAWPAVFKTWSWRDWQVFADMFGFPLAIGYYQDGAGEQARTGLADAMQTIGEDGYAVLSDLTEIVIKDAVRSGDATSVYPAIISACNQAMAKLIAGATLTTDAGGAGGKGSYALGAVHENRTYNLMLSDARRVEEMFVRDIGLPFVSWNRYLNAAPPRLKIQISRETSLFERAQVIEVLGQAIEIDEDQLREDFSLRLPAPGRGVKFGPPLKITGPEKVAGSDG